MVTKYLLPLTMGVTASGSSLSGRGAPPLIDCKYSLELLHLQDTTYTFEAYRPMMVSQMTDLISALSAKYDGSRYAFSTFADKPVTNLGFSSSRGCYDGYLDDHCYMNEVALTSNSTRVVNAIQNSLIYAGGDGPEAQLEAILRAAQDPSIQWSESSVEVTRVKIIVLITDDSAHVIGDVAVGADIWWNEYGDNELFCRYYVTQECQPMCVEAGLLRPKIDDGTATAEERARFAEIESVIGSRSPPAPIPHPGSGVIGNDGCATYEFPTVEQVVHEVDSRQIKLVILHAGPYGAEQYQDLASRFADAVYIPMSEDASDVAQLVDEAVAEILSRQCYGPDPTTDDSGNFVPVPTPPPATTTPRPVTTTTTKSTTTTTKSTTVSTTTEASTTTVEDSTTTTADPTTSTTTEGSTTTTEASETTDGGVPVTTDEGVIGEDTTTATTEATTTDEGAVVPPPVAVVPPPAEGGTSTGVIIGSAAAGAAVIAGAAAWFTGGFGMMGGNAASATAMVNADVPEAPVEREVAEAIEMDMFA